MSNVAAFFDLDKTIIATSASAALSNPFVQGGIVTRADVLRTAYAHITHLLGSAGEQSSQRLTKQLSEMATGWDVERVRKVVAESVHESVDPYVYAEAAAIINEHHELGHDVIVVSASGSELVEPIAAMLGADHTIATRMVVKDGKYTGDIEFHAYGENKAVAIRDLAQSHGYDLERSYAYTDSITDGPMLDAVGRGFVVNPDRELRELAVEKGWGILNFARPVMVQSAMRVHRAKALSVLAFGAAIVLAIRAVTHRK
ncbi:MAG: HAD-IB family hydrolase [Cellulomonadaceae bacterium]|nr:HAD-IB family hydrolase [Cellulomonadaceae bacterium]